MADEPTTGKGGDSGRSGTDRAGTEPGQTRNDPRNPERDDDRDRDVDPADQSRVRERRTFSRTTPEALENYRRGLEQEKEYARIDGENGVEGAGEHLAAVEAELGKLGSHRMYDDDDELAVVGTANLDVNSSKVAVPAREQDDPTVVQGEGSMPRGVAQPPEIRSIPMADQHTADVERRSRRDREAAAREGRSADADAPRTAEGKPK